MQIVKSKGVKDIGHMENKLREMRRELAMVRSTESIRRTQLHEENGLLKSSYRKGDLNKEISFQSWKDNNKKREPRKIVRQ